MRKVEGVDETLRPFTACDASLRMDHRPPVERQPHRLVALQFENALQDLRQGHRSVHACTAVDPNIERSWDATQGFMNVRIACRTLSRTSTMYSSKMRLLIILDVCATSLSSLVEVLDLSPLAS